MKNFFYLLSLIVVLTSCTADPIEPTPIADVERPARKEFLKCDTEDNIINIDNCGWLHNSNLDWDNWDYYQIRGFQLNANEFIITSNNCDVILSAKLIGVNPSLYTTEVTPHKVIFRYENYLFNSGDVIDVELKMQL